jgi:hypothetical protein
VTRRAAAGLVLLAGTALLGGMIGEAAAKPKRPPMNFASPARIVAADVVLSQLARRKGQWTAFRAFATEDAVMFVPRPVVARSWLKSQKDPAAPVDRQSQQVWLSCDGSLAVSYGAQAQADGTSGYYTTVWQRQKNGDYKWVMDQSDVLASPLPAPEMIGAGVAACERGAGPHAGPAAPAPAFPAGTRGGWSDDRTLSWAVALGPDCSRTLTVSLSRGAGKPMEAVLQKRVAAPASIGQATGCQA